MTYTYHVGFNAIMKSISLSNININRNVLFKTVYPFNSFYATKIVVLFNRQH